MSDELSNATFVMDKVQVEFLGEAPSKENLSAWFNACLNSACGPIKHRYGEQGDMIVAGLLQMWADTAKKKAEKAA